MSAELVLPTLTAELDDKPSEVRPFDGDGDATANSSAGRRLFAQKPKTKITLVLAKHHILYLDFVQFCMRLRHPARGAWDGGLVCARAELVAALVEFMSTSGIDFSHCVSAKDITASLVPIFRDIPQPRTRMPTIQWLVARLNGPQRKVTKLDTVASDDEHEIKNGSRDSSGIS